MKNVLLIFVLILAFNAANAQYVAVSKIPTPKALIGIGLTTGYSSKETAVFELYTSMMVTKKIVLYPVSFKYHSSFSNPTIPVIIEPRAGYKLNTWEFYGGYGYHIAGMDGRKEYMQYRGFKPGAGIIKHFGILELTAGVAGNVYTLQAGIFGVK